MVLFAEIITNIDFHGQVFWLALIIGLFGFWIWYTHRTAGRSPVVLKGLWIIWSLRGLGAILLIFLFFEPDLNLSISESKPKKILVLVDQSASMKSAWQSEWSMVLQNFRQTGNDISRDHKLIWATMTGPNITPRDGLNAIRFDGKFSPFPSKLSTPMRDQIEGVVLFSDGQFNVGRSPLDAEWINNIPIYPVIPALPKSPTGLKIDALIVPDFVRAEDSLPIQLFWHSLSAELKNATFSITDVASNTAIVETRVAANHHIRTKIKLSEPGIHRLRFTIKSANPEVAVEARKMVRVGKSRQHVVLIADALTPLVGVVQRSLPDSNYTLESLILTKQGRFMLNADPEKTESPDLLILLDDGMLGENRETAKLITRIYQDSIPTVIFNRGQSRLHQLIGGLQSERMVDDGAFVPTITPEGSAHPLGIMANSPGGKDANMDFWVSLPPLVPSANDLMSTGGIPIFQRIGVARPQAVIILDRTRPLVIFNGDGYWRWFFRPVGGTHFEQFWNQVLTYLINRADMKLVAIQLQSRENTVGDDSPIIVQVRDIEGAPLEGGMVSLSQTKIENKRTDALGLDRIGPGTFQANLNTFENGNYHLRATVDLNGTTWGADTVTVNIAPFSAEMQQTGVNRLMLDRLAVKSGGNIINLAEGVNMKFPQTEYVIWHEFHWPGIRSTWLIILMIVVFGLEWAYRRRIGLM